MKSTLASILLVLLATGLAHAQFITWSTPAAITGDSDIVTTGTYIYAIKAGATAHSDYTTANGVVFHTHSDPGPGSFSDGIISITGDGPNGGNTSIGTASTSDPAYNAVLTGILYFYGGSPTTGTATFSGLTAGDNYRVQIWNTSGASGWGNTTYTGSPSTDSVAFSNDSVIGTFTAAGSTASFSITGNGGFPMVSAIALYSVADVPEPSVYAMLGLGLLALVGFRRFRQLGA